MGNTVLPSSGNKARFEKLVCENVAMWGISWKVQSVPNIVLLGLILYAAKVIHTNPNTCVQWLRTGPVKVPRTQKYYKISTLLTIEYELNILLLYAGTSEGTNCFVFLFKTNLITNKKCFTVSITRFSFWAYNRFELDYRFRCENII